MLQINEPAAEWSWPCKSHREWHVVAFILSEVCIRPLGPEINDAWDVMTRIYYFWQRNHLRSDTLLEKTLVRSMKRTLNSRPPRQEVHAPSVGQEALTGMVSLASNEAELDLNDVP